MTKYLIVGLGNVGNEYLKTRHNIGFEVIDFLANNFEVKMTDLKLGAMGSFNHKGKKIILLKPSTLMNRSGKSVRYWALKEKIALQNILIVTDDLHLPFSLLRLKEKVGMGGIMALKISNPNLIPLIIPDYVLESKVKKKFNQVNFVLGKFTKKETEIVNKKLPQCIDIIISFTQLGLDRTMSKFNTKAPKERS